MNIDQYRACAPGLDKLRRYAAGADPMDYDAATLVALVDGFRSVLQRHLTNEVSTLLKLEADYDSGALLKMWRVAEKAAGMPPNFIDEVLPLVLGLSDRTYEGDIQDFPPVPWFLPYLVHYWFARKHAGAWRCLLDMWSKPRELQFVGVSEELDYFEVLIDGIDIR